ncbi:MAG: O-antigen ligase family protein [Parachlamydiales bacterium]|nr:O-antigen ligase family protein [Parachlamydiales bacterium]
MKWVLTLLFAALGPLGNILTPHFLPASFRAYYFLLPLFPFFYLFVKERIAKVAIVFLPFLIYSFISATIVEKFGSTNEPHTAFRFFLFLCQFYFILGAASHLKEQKNITTLLKTYLLFYFISMFFGYILFSGYYLKLVPLHILDRFSVLTQFGFGILRFSPGSYPNEYGIVSSFVLSILILLFLEKRTEDFGFSKKWFYFLLTATFLAFILTTTRAAYLSFCVSLFYIAWKSGKFLKIVSYTSFFISAFFSLLLLAKINMFKILTTGFTQKFNEGSLGERYQMWQETVEKAEGHSFWGAGFASLTNVHNVYLQLFFELGFVGLILLIGSLFLSFLESHGRYRKREADPFLSKIRMVGLVNVLSFAASNHNLNHHLTWFVCFLCFAALRYPYLKISQSESLDPL